MTTASNTGADPVTSPARAEAGELRAVIYRDGEPVDDQAPAMTEFLTTLTRSLMDKGIIPTNPSKTRAVSKLVDDLRPFASKSLGSVRIGVDEVKTLVEWFDCLPATASPPAEALPSQTSGAEAGVRDAVETALRRIGGLAVIARKPNALRFIAEVAEREVAALAKPAPAVEAVREAVDKARSEERDACARMAYAYAAGKTKVWRYAAQDIATAIQSGATEETFQSRKRAALAPAAQAGTMAQEGRGNV